MVERVRANAQTISQFISFINTSISDINREVTHSQSPEIIDGAIFRVDTLIVNFHRVRDELNDEETFSSLLDQLTEILDILHILQTSELESDASGYRVPLTEEKKTGRPSYIILPEQLKFFLGIGFSVTSIARMLGVDRSTIHDRMRKFNLSIRATYVTISDGELDESVAEIAQHNRNIGYRGMRSRLDANGKKVSYERVRQSLLRVDPAAVALRFGNTVHRRTYKVAGPNSLWHFDGNHKLITFKFVVHGGIDGYSRMLTWLRVSTNNRAQTVLDAFKGAVKVHGCPSRVRCDRGVENGMVVTYMTEKWGAAHRPAIVGSSVHNQRIERAWRDVFQGSLCVFYDIFTSLVTIGALDLTSEVQMYAFHYAFKPIIQRSLDNFVEAYNRHPLSSESGKTPYQLFFSGVMDPRKSGTAGVKEFWNRVSGADIQSLGIDGDGPVPELDRLTSEVNLQDISCPFPDNVQSEIKNRFDPCTMCPHDNAVGVYGDVLRFLAEQGY